MGEKRFVSNQVMDTIKVAFHKYYDNEIEFVDTNAHLLDDHLVNLEVNWSSIGATSPVVAVKFAENLTFAAIMADKINSLKLTEQWVLTNKLFKSKDEYIAIIRYLMDLIEHENQDSIITWILARSSDDKISI